MSNESTSQNETVRTYEDIGPYAAHFIVNIKLEAAGSDRTVSGPQMYNYAKNKAIKSNYHSRQQLPSGKLEPVMLDGKDFAEWLEKFVAGGAKASRKDYAKLAEQY